MEGRKVPEIRFEGFEGEWEQRKFGDCNDLITGYPFESEKFTEQGIKLVRGMNVKRGYLDFTDEICMMWDSSEGLENFLLENNDILIQMDGALIGKSYAKIKKSQLPALLVQRVTRARTKGEIADTNFMYQTIQRDFLHYIVMNKTETAVPHLSLNDIREFRINVPSLEEQQRIGNYFDHLDRLITLHQCKYKKLKYFKEAMLDKMLPRNDEKVPKIRFEEYTGDWGHHRLVELVERIDRKNTNHESNLPLTISAQYGLVDQNTFFNSRVAAKDISNYYLILNGEFAYNKSTSDGYPCGAIKRLDLYEKGVLSTLYIVFSIKDSRKTDSDFMTVFFDSDRWHKGVSERAAEGARNHGLLNISVEDFFDIDLYLPKTIDEQKKIAAYFMNLNRYILLCQKKIEKLKNFKKSILEKMFI